MYITPTSKHVIPVHPSTQGYSDQRLAVDVHEFPSKEETEKKVGFLFIHANGYTKECHHPFYRLLIDHLRGDKKHNHTSFTFVSFDSRYNGDSARLNEGANHATYRGIDHALDAKQVVQTMGLESGYDQLFGVGHSFGATALCILEVICPNTFTGVVASEIVVSSTLQDAKKTNEYGLGPAILKRLDEWPSRAACEQHFMSKSLFRALNPELQKIHLQYAFYDTDKGTVKTKCTPAREAHIVFIRPVESYLLFKNLPLIKCPVHLVFATQSIFLKPGELNLVMKQCQQDNVTFETMKGGHLLPYEKIDIILPWVINMMERVSYTPPKSIFVETARENFNAKAKL